MRLLNSMALANTIFGVAPKAESGSFFVRAYSGQWIDSVCSGRFTLINTAGIWLYFDAASGCWIAEIAGLNKPLRVRGTVQAKKLATVALSWGNKKGKQVVSLRADDSVEPCRAAFELECGLANFSQARVGSNLRGKDHWNGSIYSCVSDDRPIGSKSWSKYLRHRELVPNPFDADRIAYAINNPT
jgi:hypothetical protein